VAWVFTVYAGLTMVSNAPFYSFKDINLRRSVPFIVVLGVVLLFVLVSSDPPVVLFSLFVLYGLSGWAVWLWRLKSGRAAPWRESAGGSAQPPAAAAPPPPPTVAPPRE
jgi:CDP-diacylglycerol--serine O-phosphatidyltransferase